MIELRKLTHGYKQDELIFQDYSWKIDPGELLCVLGPSGCGKTTLLYLLAGLWKPLNGSILVNGEVLERPRPKTGLVIQDYGLLPWATVEQNASLGLTIREFYGPDGTHAPRNFQPGNPISYWLNRLNLEPHSGKYPGQLSGGQRQRTAIARTLILEPDLILLDEPFSSLDAPTRESLQGLILELYRENNLTMVFVTHSIEEAAYLGKQILVLNNPPNLVPNILVNKNAGNPGFRQRIEYQKTCRTLRSILDDREENK